MLRLLGGALLLLGTLLLGRHASARLRQRPKELRSWIDALELLRTDIAAMTPLPEALLHASSVQGCAGAYLESVVTRIRRENRMLCEIWDEQLGTLPLRSEEQDRLRTLGAQLGRYDAAAQLRALDRCICDFARWEREATDKTGAEAGLRLRLIGATGTLLLIVLW